MKVDVLALGMRMVRGLAATEASRIAAARADQPFGSVDDMWHRSGVPPAYLIRLAEADAYLPSLGMQRRDALWADDGRLVLVRQKPGSAKGVMFLTIEDETEPANIVVWPKLFDRRRQVVSDSNMMAINGRIQREGRLFTSSLKNCLISRVICRVADRD